MIRHLYCKRLPWITGHLLMGTVKDIVTRYAKVSACAPERPLTRFLYAVCYVLFTPLPLGLSKKYSFWHSNGYHVERRAGWDTHGLVCSAIFALFMGHADIAFL